MQKTQNFVFFSGIQQSPPSKLHLASLVASSQKPSPAISHPITIQGIGKEVLRWFGLGIVTQNNLKGNFDVL